ncbi:heterokaryon incompatibility protein-domain-containing protein [Xylariales sp. PMI_506]|nr:heterokaryon incompatibility protein-domain-containing protein [Xylariales sp. PMI_506]
MAAPSSSSDVESSENFDWAITKRVDFIDPRIGIWPFSCALCERGFFSPGTHEFNNNCAMCCVVNSIYQQCLGKMKTLTSMHWGSNNKPVYASCLDETLQIMLFKIPGVPCPWRHAEASPVSIDSNSPQSWAHAQSWLKTCLATHSRCALSSLPQLPTRIIDLRGAIPKLCITKGDTGSYAALSYCWGSTNSITTTKQNLPSHECGIDSDAMPQTIRDAFTVAKRLGFQYMWIDSLCIVQDDPDDWAAESTRMASVYGNADLVIAAASAKCASEGFLASKARDVRGAVYFQNQLDPSKSYGVHYCLNPGFTHGSYDGAAGPLLSRAWAYQELLFARRYLMYGAHELSWRCNELFACECEMGGVGTNEQTGLRATWSSTSVLNILQYGNQPDVLYNTWVFEILPRYSSLAATRFGDRLVAISAVSNSIANMTNDRVIYGIYLNHALVQIGWQVRRPSARPLEDLPTWSWASVNNEVSLQRQTRYFLGLDKELSPAIPSQPRVLRFQGKLCRSLLEFPRPYDKLLRDEPWKGLRSFALFTSEGSMTGDGVRIRAGFVRFDQHPDELPNSSVLDSESIQRLADPRYPMIVVSPTEISTSVVLYAEYADGLLPNWKFTFMLLNPSRSLPGAFQRIGLAHLHIDYTIFDLLVSFYQGIPDESILLT